MKKYTLAVDLKDDEDLIAEYESHHRNGSKAIAASIIDAGILKMEIYRVSNRLVMLIETDQNNQQVQAWEDLMWKFQQPLPFAKEGEKWVQLHKTFELGNESFPKNPGE